jgi:hypothetical protein
MEVKGFYEWCEEWGLATVPAFNLVTHKVIWIKAGEKFPRQYGFPFPGCQHAPAFSFTGCEACARQLLAQAREARA